jgi:hypothetical protein
MAQHGANERRAWLLDKRTGFGLWFRPDVTARRALKMVGVVACTGEFKE